MGLIEAICHALVSLGADFEALAGAINQDAAVFMDDASSSERQDSQIESIQRDANASGKR